MGDDEAAADVETPNGRERGGGVSTALSHGIAAILGDSFTRNMQPFILPPTAFSFWKPTSSFIASMNLAIAPAIDSLVTTASMANILNTSVSSWFAKSAEWHDLFTRILATAGLRLPTNWVGIEERADPEILNKIVRDEGLPLCWVAPKQVVRRLIDAETAQARRDLIGRHSAAILRECEEQLSHITSPIGRRYTRFAAAAVRAVEAQHREAGQALATNTLDSLIQRYGLKPPAQNNPPDLGDFDLTDALVLGALWATYFSYQPDRDEYVPREFRRHASAHGVSSRQYTLRNATIAIMHLVAVLRWLELQGFERQTKRIWS